MKTGHSLTLHLHHRSPKGVKLQQKCYSFNSHYTLNFLIFLFTFHNQSLVHFEDPTDSNRNFCLFVVLLKLGSQSFCCAIATTKTTASQLLGLTYKYIYIYITNVYILNMHMVGFLRNVFGKECMYF